MRAMQTMMEAFPDLDVGYSDHTLNPVASLCAVAMGARVIERHFTYDKAADGPDHMLSADPAEMKWLVDAIRAFEVMKGSGRKEPAASEATTRLNNRKSIVVNRPLKAGHVFSAGDISVKRPGTGIEPKHLDTLAGRRLVKDLDADAVL
ncbi:N-acetylneuraminate synthase family protein, partial [Rhizobium ruizarguesonis]